MNIEPQTLIGTWRRFGSFGPIYEIVSELQDDACDQKFMRVRVVESGEELSYSLSEILEDPRER